MRAIITGATGMIGIALTNELLAQGYDCIAIVRENSKKTHLLPKHPKLEIVECNIDHLKELNIDKPCDYFIHLAWQATTGQDRDNSYLQLENIQYSLDAVALAKKCGCTKFVGVGSQAEYGIKSELLSENTSTSPKSAYGAAKFAASRLTYIMAKQLGIQHSWARILSIFGPNDNPNSLISYLIKSMLQNQTVELTKCEQVWDYLYVKDCARALRCIAEKGHDEAIYVIGSGEKRKLSEYVESVKKMTNSDSIIKFGAKDYYPNQPMYLCADTSLLQKDTGYTSKYSFEEGIKETIEYNKCN